MTTNSDRRSDGDTVARESTVWFNPHRIPKSSVMADVIEEAYRKVDGYEFTVLNRKRSRTQQEAKNLRLLVASLIADLVYHKDWHPDVPLLVLRTNKVLSRKSIYRPEYFTKKFRIVLDALAFQPPAAKEQVAWIELTLGHQDHGFVRGTTSMIKTTKTFQNEIDFHQIDSNDTGLCPGEEVLILRDTRIGASQGYRNLVEYSDTPDTIKVREDVRRINDYLENADIDLDTSYVSTPVDTRKRRMRRLFTLGSFETGGRLFGGFWQNLSRKVRSDALTIDGESVVTLDYSQLALRVAYGMVGEDLPVGDGYELPGLERYRNQIKKLVNSMLFPQGKGWKLVPSSISKKLPDRFTDEALVAAVKDRHPALDSIWWSDIGHRIQRTESDIIVRCLLECIELDIPALQVHDALIIPASKQAAVTDIMLRTFKDIAKIDGEVTVEV